MGDKLPKDGLEITFTPNSEPSEWDDARATLSLCLTRSDLLALARLAIDKLEELDDAPGETEAWIELPGCGTATLAGRLPTRATYLENGTYVPGVVVLDEVHDPDSIEANGLVVVTTAESAQIERDET